VAKPVGFPTSWRRLSKLYELAKKYDGSKARKAGLNNELIAKSNDEPNMDAAVECQERLGGVLKYYYRRAA
jgi:hypothetical protein